MGSISQLPKSASPGPEGEVVAAVRTNAVTGQLEIRDHVEPREEQVAVNDQEEKGEDENNNSAKETEVVVKDKPHSNSRRPPVASRPVGVSDTTSSSTSAHKSKEAAVLPPSLPTTTSTASSALDSTRRPKLSAKPTLRTQENEKEGRRERGVGAEKSNTAKPLTRGEKADQPTASRPAIPLPSVSSLSGRANQPTANRATVAPLTIDGASVRANQLLRKLHCMMKANDYYSLLGVDPSAEQDELARARREITSKLHPDHYIANPKQQARYLPCVTN